MADALGTVTIATTYLLIFVLVVGLGFFAAGRWSVRKAKQVAKDEIKEELAHLNFDDWMKVRILIEEVRDLRDGIEGVKSNTNALSQLYQRIEERVDEIAYDGDKDQMSKIEHIEGLIQKLEK